MCENCHDIGVQGNECLHYNADSPVKKTNERIRRGYRARIIHIGLPGGGGGIYAELRLESGNPTLQCDLSEDDPY